MKSLVVVVSALVLLLVAAAHLYRAYAGIPILVAGHAVPMVCSWTAGGISGVLGLALLLFARK